MAAGGPQQLPKCPLQAAPPFWRMLRCQVLYDPCTRVLYRSSIWLPAAIHARKAAAPHCKSKTLAPRALGAISGNNRGVKEALKVPAIEIVPKSLENKKFNF